MGAFFVWLSFSSTSWDVVSLHPWPEFVPQPICVPDFHLISDPLLPQIFYPEDMMKTRQNRNEQPLRLLIVDGVTHTRRNLASFLQLQENLEVVGETAVAAEAIHLTGQLKPDVVIMDINLPDGDGFTATQQLRALKVPPAVILLTIHHHELALIQAKQAGAVNCIEKSVGVDAILDALYAQSKSKSGE